MRIAKNVTAKYGADEMVSRYVGLGCRHCFEASSSWSRVERLQKLFSSGNRGCTSAHSLAEFYSVLTRTPFQPPIHSMEAWQIIEAAILPHLELITLSAADYRTTVKNCAVNGWTGGRVHDAVHLRCAEKAKADRIYTFNVKDFRALAPSHLQDKIILP